MSEPHSPTNPVPYVARTAVGDAAGAMKRATDAAREAWLDALAVASSRTSLPCDLRRVLDKIRIVKRHATRASAYLRDALEASTRGTP